MLAISRARDDEHIWPDSAYAADDFIDRSPGLNGDDHPGRLHQPASFKESRLRRIAVIYLVAVAAIACHAGSLVIDRDVFHAVSGEQRTQDLSNSAMANHDGLMFVTGRANRQFWVDGAFSRQARCQASAKQAKQ